jgi:Nucleotide-diphospho-sugar transferase
MTAINYAWAAPDSFLDLFFDSFYNGDQILHLLNHLIIVAMDQKAFDRCKSRHPHCYFLKVEGLNFSAEQSYMKGDYLEMMWRRNRFQQSILELGYNFLFTVRLFLVVIYLKRVSYN